MQPLTVTPTVVDRGRPPGHPGEDRPGAGARTRQTLGWGRARGPGKEGSDARPRTRQTPGWGRVRGPGKEGSDARARRAVAPGAGRGACVFRRDKVVPLQFVPWMI